MDFSLRLEVCDTFLCMGMYSLQYAYLVILYIIFPFFSLERPTVRWQQCFFFPLTQRVQNFITFSLWSKQSSVWTFFKTASNIITLPGLCRSTNILFFNLHSEVYITNVADYMPWRYCYPQCKLTYCQVHIWSPGWGEMFGQR